MGRYDNPPKVGKKGGSAPNKDESAAKSEAEATAGSGMPHADKPGAVGKEGSDPGPDAGKDSTWGVVASRHKAEHGEMLKRHASEHEQMVGRHHEEAGKMHARHAKEMQDGMESSAAAKAEATAGNPKELGETKSEGKGGMDA